MAIGEPSEDRRDAPARHRSSVSGPRLGGALPIVAIVGRPNVGKSTLFNRVIGSRTAIVEDRARTTRDRLYGDAEWNGRRFVIVDTGGLEVDTDDPIEARVQEQARLAISEADVILFVVDAASRHDARRPRGGRAPPAGATAPVIVAVNKADNEKREIEARRVPRAWAGTRPTRSPRATVAGPATCSMRSCGRCRPRAEQELDAQVARG